MRQKILIFLLAAVVLFSQAGLVEAKGSVGGRSGGFSSHSSGGFSGSSSSKSFGSSSKSSSNSSKGFSGSSSSKSSVGGSSSSKGSSGSSSNGFSGSSSSKSMPGSYSSKSTGTSSSSKASSAKSTYMSDTYSKQASSRNYKTYQQSLNSDQQSAKTSSYGRNYTVNNRMGFEDAMNTRNVRINNYNSRTIFVNVNPGYFGGPLSYGSAYVGCWDLWFLMRASDLFWYHHWNDIYPYRSYFEAQQFAQMEARVQRLEQQNLARDPNYLDPNVDPDLQFSDDYIKNNPDKVFYTNKNTGPSINPFVILFSIFLIIIGLILIIRFVSRPRPKESFKSRIY